MGTTRRLVVAIGGLGLEKESYPEVTELGKSGDVVLFTNLKGTTVREKAAWVMTQLPESLEGIDIIGFSQGCLVATEIACHLETLRCLVLVNPAGLIGDDSSLCLTCRFILQIVEEWAYALKCAFRLNLKPLRNSARANLDFLKNCLCNFHLWQEISEMAQARVVPSLRDLKKRSVNIVLLTAENDRIFPKERIVKTLEEEPDLIDEWTMFPEKDASHNASYLQETGIIRQVLGW